MQNLVTVELLGAAPHMGDFITFQRSVNNFLPRCIVCRAVFPMSVCPSVCLSVYLSVRLSVKRVNCDRTKAPSEKNSIMTNRKSTTSFPMSLR